MKELLETKGEVEVEIKIVTSEVGVEVREKIYNIWKMTFLNIFFKWNIKYQIGSKYKYENKLILGMYIYAYVYIKMCVLCI